MAFQVKTAKRSFVLEKGKGKKEEIILKDPHPKMSLPEVVSHYSSKHPEIITATINGPTMEEGVAVYRFSTVIGDKG